MAAIKTLISTQNAGLQRLVVSIGSGSVASAWRLSCRVRSPRGRPIMAGGCAGAAEVAGVELDAEQLVFNFHASHRLAGIPLQSMRGTRHGDTGQWCCRF